MIIKIDTRENDLFIKCRNIFDDTFLNNNNQYTDISLVSETLHLGDIIINDNTNDCIIIERKTLSDLAASIKDGRYEEQSYRLNGLPHHNHNIIYLIEGDFSKFHSGKEKIPKNTLYSAIFSINYYKGFSIMRTNNIDETAIFICNSAHKLLNETKKGKQPFYTNIITNNSNDITNNNELITCKDYCNVIKKVKKDNITTDNIGEIMLCQIPGISSVSALAILQQFKTLPNLIKSINDDDTCLNNIYTMDATGKQRKLNKNVISSIITFLKIK